MDNANVAEAEARLGPNGETIREMIGNTYRCAVGGRWWFLRS
jgi:hypothetical protein